jgi:hypothetical protein
MWHICETDVACRVFMGKPEGKIPLLRLNVHRRIILKRFLKDICLGGGALD